MVLGVALSQADADALIVMAKRFSRTPQPIPMGVGAAHVVDIESHDETERFHANIARGRIQIDYLKYHLRGRRTVPLLRLEVRGNPHRNPDGTIVHGTHLHRYREGYDCKWAEALDPALFSSDSEQVLEWFCDLITLDITGYQPTLGAQ